MEDKLVCDFKLVANVVRGGISNLEMESDGIGYGWQPVGLGSKWDRGTR